MHLVIKKKRKRAAGDLRFFIKKSFVASLPLTFNIDNLLGLREAQFLSPTRCPRKDFNVVRGTNP